MPKPLRARELVEEITRGRLCSIHLARDIAEDGSMRRSVVKRLRPEFGDFPGWSELITDEAHLLSAIDHPNVVACYDAGSEGGAFVVVEYVEGDSLEGLLRRSDVWRWPRLVAAVIADALRGLSAAHGARTADGLPLQIVHQALHPRHILVGIEGHARIVDFTQARVKKLAPGGYRAERLKGGLVAPELNEDPNNVDLRADLYVLGATLWESLTGEKLFRGGEAARRPDAIRSPSTVGLAPPKAFDEVCLRALAHDPQQRFASAQEMLNALLAAAEQAGGIAPAQEIGHWVRTTDALGKQIGKDKAPMPALARTLNGAVGALAAAEARAAEAAAPAAGRPRRETMSWFGTLPPAETPPPAAPGPRRSVTLLGVSASPLHPSSAPAAEIVESEPPTSKSMEPILGHVVARATREDEPSRETERVPPPQVRIDDPARAARVRESIAGAHASFERARASYESIPPTSANRGKRALGWALTVAMLAGVLFVGDLAMARVLPWPAIELVPDEEAAPELGPEQPFHTDMAPVEVLRTEQVVRSEQAVRNEPVRNEQAVPSEVPAAPAAPATRARTPRAPTAPGNPPMVNGAAAGAPSAPATPEQLPDNPY